MTENSCAYINYVEPNYVGGITSTTNTNVSTVTEMQTPLEDLCILVSLDVDIPGRNYNAFESSETKHIRMQWTNSQDKGEKVNFLQGTTFSINGKKQNFLTTSYTDIFYTDLKAHSDGLTKTDGTNEMFGIESIDIQYKDWSTPLVTIKFTDVRGASLFSLEEYRHTKSARGMNGLVDEDVTGSFFKSFFTMPYPKFKLTVKGFYGKPVSYKLSVVNWNAKFDSNTGNFNVTAVFTGYDMAFLHDIILNALLISPDTIKGSEYWDKSTTFVLDDGTKMKKMSEILASIEQIDQATKDAISNSEGTKQLNDIDAINSDLQSLTSSLSQLNTDIVAEADTDGKKILDGEGNLILIYHTNENVSNGSIPACDDNSFATSAPFSTSLNDKYEKIYDEITRINTKYPDYKIPYPTANDKKDDYLDGAHGVRLYPLKNNEKFIPFNINYSTKEKLADMGLGEETYNIILNTAKESSTYNSILIFSYKHTYDAIKSLNDAEENTKKEAEKKVITDTREAVDKVIGFKFSVKNIIKTLWAHLETLIYLIEDTALATTQVKDRTLENLGTKIEFTDINSEEGTKITVPPFPMITSATTGGNGEEKEVEIWIGDVTSNEGLAPEIPLIKDLLESVNAFKNAADKASAVLEGNNSGDNTNVKFAVKNPLTSLDAIITGNPFGNVEQTEFDNVTSILGRIYGRTISLCASGLDVSSSDIKDSIGKRDAENFYELFKDRSWGEFGKWLVNKGWFEQKEDTAEEILKGESDLGNARPWGSLDKNIVKAFGILNDNDENSHNAFIPIQDWTYKDLIQCRKNGGKKTQNPRYTRLLCQDANQAPSNSAFAIHDEVDKYLEFDFTENLYEDIEDYATLVFLRDLNDVEAKKFLPKKDYNEIKNGNYILRYFPKDSNGKYLLQDKEFLNSDKYTQAYLFLKGYQLKIKDWKEDFFYDGEKTINIMPKMLILYYASCLYINTLIGKSPFTSELFDKKSNLYKEVCNVQTNWFSPNDGSVLRYDIKQYLITYFKKWVDSVFTPCINDIIDNYENSYETRQGTRINVGLNSIKTLSNSLLYPCSVINGLGRVSYYLINEKNKSFYPSDRLNSYTGYFHDNEDYMATFLSKLLDLYEEDGQSETGQTHTENAIIPTDALNNELARVLYKYIKTIYDRWLYSTTTKDWSVERWFGLNGNKEKVHFIDAYYNEINNLAINPLKFIKEIIANRNQQEHSLISFISQVLADNNAILMFTQNFVGTQDVDSMQKMFTPLSWEDSIHDIEEQPEIVILWEGEPSKHLDLGKDANFKDDGFDLFGNEVDLPLAIKSKGLASPYKIPCFGVSYGRQYQSYFINIDVGNESPMVTEQSLRAQMQIVGIDENTGENKNTVFSLGQDLYTVYANNSYTCTITMMGCAWVQPLMYFQLNNVPMFRGSYLIEKVSHNIVAGQMTTTIVGVRMAKNQTPLIDPTLCYRNDGAYGNDTDTEAMKYAIASTDNDCPYQIFSPLGESVEISGLAKNVAPNRFNNAVYNNKTIGDVIAASAYAEMDKDILSCQLAAMIIYNRYYQEGKNWEKVFQPNQFNFGPDSAYGAKNTKASDFLNGNVKDSQKIKEAVIAVFSNPNVLVGKQTTVKSPVMLYKNGTPQGLAKPHTITLEDLQWLYHWDGKSFGDYEKKRKNSRYAFQHDITASLGSIFAYTMDRKTPFWTSVPQTETTNGSELKKLSQGLVNAIKMTADVAGIPNDFKYSINEDLIHITSGKKLHEIFDICLNGYYDYIQLLDWFTDSNGLKSEDPKEIYIRVSKNPQRRQIGVCIGQKNNGRYAFYTNSNMQQKIEAPTPDYSDYLYRSLSKKYMPLTNESNWNAFKSDFVSYTNPHKETMIALLKKYAPEDCMSALSSGLLEDDTLGGRYQWTGSTNPENRVPPPQKQAKAKASGRAKSGGYNINACTQYLVNKTNNATHYGSCARYVREALGVGGIDVSKHPYSACRYDVWLPTYGFTQIYATISARKPIPDGYVPQDGDVAVIAGSPRHIHGHIVVYCSQGRNGKWLSDFASPNLNPYSDYPDCPVKIFRYKG